MSQLSNQEQHISNEDAELSKFEDLTNASLSLGSTTYTGTVEPSCF